MSASLAYVVRSPNRARWLSTSAAVLGSAFLILLLYLETIADAVGVWIGSQAHQFSFLVLPVSLYFIWIRRDDLARITPQPLPFVAVLALPLGVLWLAAEAAQVAMAAQVAVVALLQVVVLTMFGLQVFRAILFPMLFLWLLVPFGEFFLPALMEMTSTLTVVSLNFLGLATQAEGIIFRAGLGEYSIVEGCASLDFLIGNAVISLVFANLMYLGFVRRAVYVVASFPVAVFANIFRTTSIVMIAEYSDGNIDIAMDHGLYGWLIFCLAVLIQMSIGLRFRDSGDQAGRAVGADMILHSARYAPSRSLTGAIVAIAVAISAPPLYAMFNTHLVTAVPNVSMCIPAWLEDTRAPQDPAEWLPVYKGSQTRIHARAEGAGQSPEGGGAHQGRGIVERSPEGISPVLARPCRERQGCVARESVAPGAPQR